MLKSKRAQGIPMETVVIAIIVLVVLIVIIAIFVGGTGTVKQKIQQLFGGATAGTDKQQAVVFCQQYCEQIGQAGGLDVNPNDYPYCTKYFYIDSMGSGSADRVSDDPKQPYVKYYCHGNVDSTNTKTLGVACPPHEDNCRI